MHNLNIYELPEDGDMTEMTLPSRHRIRNSNPGVLMPCPLLLIHVGSPQYWIFTDEQGSNILFLCKTWLSNIFFKQATLTTAPGPQPQIFKKFSFPFIQILEYNIIFSFLFQFSFQWYQERHRVNWIFLKNLQVLTFNSPVEWYNGFR